MVRETQTFEHLHRIFSKLKMGRESMKRYEWDYLVTVFFKNISFESWLAWLRYSRSRKTHKIHMLLDWPISYGFEGCKRCKALPRYRQGSSNQLSRGPRTSSASRLKRPKQGSPKSLAEESTRKTAKVPLRLIQPILTHSGENKRLFPPRIGH